MSVNGVEVGGIAIPDRSGRNMLSLMVPLPALQLLDAAAWKPCTDLAAGISASCIWLPLSNHSTVTFPEESPLLGDAG